MRPHVNTSYAHGARHVRDHYESLITSGKIRVVEEVGVGEDSSCLKCGHYTDDQYGMSFNFCPGCGNPIKKP